MKFVSIGRHSIGNCDKITGIYKFEDRDQLQHIPILKERIDKLKYDSFFPSRHVKTIQELEYELKNMCPYGVRIVWLDRYTENFVFDTAELRDEAYDKLLEQLEQLNEL